MGQHYVMFTGGRKYASEATVREVLDFLQKFYGKDLRVLHGGAPGLDKLVDKLCKEMSIKFKEYQAQWKTPGGGVDKTAGFKRNQLMVDLVAKWSREGHSAQVISFPGGNGTKHASDAAEMAGLMVDYIKEG